jgi:hypothetical protein
MQTITKRRNDCLKQFKRLNLIIHGVEEGAEIQTKSIGNLFNEIIEENFPPLCNDIATYV